MCSFVLVLALSSCLSGHYIGYSASERRVRRVFVIEDMEKYEIFLRAYLWMTETLHKTEGEVLFEDKEHGVLIGTSVKSGSIVKHGRKLLCREYRYYITIRCIDNLIEIVFSNVVPGMVSDSTPKHRVVPYDNALFESIKLDLYTFAEDCYRSICEEKEEI